MAGKNRDPQTANFSVTQGSLVTLTGTQTLTNKSIAASQLTGSIADARLSANVPLINGANTFTNAQVIQYNTPPGLILRDTGGANVGINLEPTGGPNYRIIGAGAFIVYDLTAGAYRVYVDPSGNIGFNFTSFGTSAAKVIAIGDGTAPGSSPAGSIQLWSQSGELKVRDSSGNVGTLSPHASDAPAWMYDVEDKQPPKITPDVNMFAGMIRWTNHTRATRLQQILFDGGALPADPNLRKIIHEESFDDYNRRRGLVPGDPDFLVKESWDANEELNRAQRHAEIEAFRAKPVEGQREPSPYVKRAKPAWLKNGNGVKSKT